MMTTKLQTLINASMMGMIAAVGLSGCVVSDDPVVNGVATAATVGAVATLFYSISDGYYYDSYYQRMPRGYRPQKNVVVHRIENIEIYRQQHPLNSRRIMQPNRMENQRMPVGYQMNPGQGHWNQQDRFATLSAANWRWRLVAEATAAEATDEKQSVWTIKPTC